ncbi:hypothetical protein KHA80_04075 [Anaerobacillus sp. HL2]|nr:hypothetical protein KHA80_04075 [Anaerobacillus sp. HL2]
MRILFNNSREYDLNKSVESIEYGKKEKGEWLLDFSITNIDIKKLKTV